MQLVSDRVIRTTVRNDPICFTAMLKKLTKLIATADAKFIPLFEDNADSHQYGRGAGSEVKRFAGDP